MAKKINNVTENSINFEEGYKEFNINGDKNRIIRFNPADWSIMERAVKAKRNILSSLETLKLDGDDEVIAEAFENANKIVKENINYIFGADVADIVFGVQSPLSDVGGVTLAERFLNAVTPIISSAIEENKKKSETKVSKYTERYHK